MWGTNHRGKITQQWTILVGVCYISCCSLGRVRYAVDIVVTIPLGRGKTFVSNWNLCGGLQLCSRVYLTRFHRRSRYFTPFNLKINFSVTVRMILNLRHQEMILLDDTGIFENHHFTQIQSKILLYKFILHSKTYYWL